MAKLGMARLHLEQGEAAQAAKEIAGIGKTDAGFLRANAVVQRRLGSSRERRYRARWKKGKPLERSRKMSWPSFSILRPEG